METKRTILAVAISIVILFGWQFFSEYMGWVKPAPAPQVQETSVAQQQAAPQPVAEPMPVAAFTPSPGKLVNVDTPLYKAVFHSGGGILHEFTLKNYYNSLKPESGGVQMISPAASAMAPMGLLLNGQPSWSAGTWQFDGSDLTVQENGSGSLRFIGEVQGLRITRELTFIADSYAITEKTTVSGSSPQANRLGFTLSTGPLAEAGNQYNLSRIAFNLDGSFKEEDSEKTLQAGLLKQGIIHWAAIMSNYFVAAVSPSEQPVTVRAKLQNGVYRVVAERENITVTPGQETSLTCTYYIGPKVQSMLSALPNEMSSVVHYGFFSIIARPLMAMLKFYYSFANNYGIAIILLTLTVKIVLWPLSYKSYKSMEQMKKLQPLMAKIKEKHKDDKETMNREMMQLYKTYKVNPASGCLPILVQIPVFFGLYQGLLNATELRHASFISYLPFTDIVWLADLSVKDPFYITPLIMGGTMFLQQYITPQSGDPTQAKIMMFMPVVFTVLFLNFPAGLVLYWLVNNIVSIAQQWWQLRKA